MIIEQMTDLIGNTPLLKIPAHITGLKNIELYAKLEMMNPFGSVKDRTAWAMVKDDLDEIKKKSKNYLRKFQWKYSEIIASYRQYSWS